MINTIQTVSNMILSLGVHVLLPIVIFIISICLGQTFKKAVVSSLTFGVAFIGLNLIIGLMIDTLNPVTQAMVEATGANKDILDVGWAVGSAIAFSTLAGALIIPVSLGVNFLMLITKTTKTINVDIWNFWNHAFTASVVYIASGNLILGLLSGAIHAALCLILADRGAKRVQEYYGIPGVSIPHGFAVTTVPIIGAVNWILDRIPVIKDIEWDDQHIKEKWGLFGNPLILGCLLGLGFGLLGGLWKTPAQLLNVSITMGAVMILIPKMTGLFMESLSSVSEAANKFFKKKFKNKEFFIGLDSAILIGHPTTVTASVILIPLVLGIALILPGNKVLPFGDLASLAYFVAMVPCLSKGNLFRSIVSGCVIMSIVLLVCSSFGSSLTQMAVSANYALPEGAMNITALSAGNWITWILFQIGRIFG